MLKQNRIRLRLNIVIAVAAFIVNAALAYVSYRLILSVGGLQLIGLWSALISATFLIRIGDLGLGAAGLRYIAALPQDTPLQQARELVDTILLCNSGVYATLAVIGFIVLPYAFPTIVGLAANSPEVGIARQVIPILMFGFLMQGISLPIMSVLQGLHHGYLSSLLSVFGLLVQMGFAVVLIPRMGLAGLAWAIVVQHAIVGLSGWIVVLRITGSVSLGMIPHNFSRDRLRQTLRYGIALQSLNIVSGLFEPLAKLLIGRFSGFDVLGIFELAFKTMNIVRGAVTSALLATVPATANLMIRDPAEAARLYLKMRRRNVLATSTLLCLALLGSSFISILWLNQIDDGFILTLCIVAFGILGNILGAPAYTLGLASGKLHGNLIAVSAALALLAVLVPTTAHWHDVASIGAVSMAMVVGGVTVKWLNERILLAR